MSRLIEDFKVVVTETRQVFRSAKRHVFIWNALSCRRERQVSVPLRRSIYSDDMSLVKLLMWCKRKSYDAGFAWSNPTCIIFWFLVLFEANSKNLVEDGKLFHRGFSLKLKIVTVFMAVSSIQNSCWRQVLHGKYKSKVTTRSLMCTRRIFRVQLTQSLL